MSAQTNNSEDELATDDNLAVESETLPKSVRRRADKSIVIIATMLAMMTGTVVFMSVTMTDAALKQHDMRIAQQQGSEAVASNVTAQKYVPPAAPAIQNPAPASSNKLDVSLNFDPTLPLTLLGFSVALFVTIKFAAPPAVSYIRSRRKRREVRTAHAQTWAELFKHKSDLMKQWSRYETDVALMIDYPIMTDYTDPAIQKVIAAMQKMRRAETIHINMSQDSTEGSMLQSAVDEFEIAFVAAEKYAKRYGQSNLKPAEIKKLSTARQALNIILDGGSPAYEVEAAYKSLRGSLKGIIDLPPQAIASLEQITRKSLDAAPVLIEVV